MIFENIKSTVLFITSFDVVLAGIALWSANFGTTMGDLQALIVSVGGVIMTYFTIQHLRVKIKAVKLDNKLKELEIKKEINSKKKL